mgnify:CR=1 FL=1
MSRTFATRFNRTTVGIDLDPTQAILWQSNYSGEVREIARATGTCELNTLGALTVKVMDDAVCSAVVNELIAEFVAHESAKERGSEARLAASMDHAY